MTTLTCLFKVTEQNRFTIIAEVFEALIEGLRVFVYLRSKELVIEKLAHQYLKFIYAVVFRQTATVWRDKKIHCQGEAGCRTRATKSCEEVTGCY